MGINGFDAAELLIPQRYRFGEPSDIVAQLSKLIAIEPVSPKTQVKTFSSDHPSAQASSVAGFHHRMLTYDLGRTDSSIIPMVKVIVSEHRVSVIDAIVRQRRTRKVLAKDSPVVLPHAEVVRLNQFVLSAIATAGFAPFHYDRKKDGVAEPWRFHILWCEECRILAGKLPEWFSDMRPGNKLASMLNACGALVLVNWLPQFNNDVSDEKKLQINEEHLAATSAAIQNLLLLLTAEGLGNYWSSGGFFQTPLMFKQLGIDAGEKLLGAIFVDYGAPESEVEIIGGKQHENRADSSKWTRVVEL